MHSGKLYRSSEEQFVTNISYRLLVDSHTSINGELIPVDYVQVSDGTDYIVELEDSRKIQCNLKKNVNLPAIGLPPRFVYHFMGS